MTLRSYIARSAGLFTKAVLTLKGSSGTALPGLVATTIDPKFVAQATQGLNSIVITGTNGKTTTAHQLTTILKQAYGDCLHNNAGSNLLRGIASSLLPGYNGKWAVFEADEAGFPEIIAQVKPKIVIILNLFRDQMDRYGEIDQVARKWRKALDALGPDTKVLVNADDPVLGYLGQGRVNTYFFGVDDDSVGTKELRHTADSILSPKTGNKLTYRRVFYSHLGDYADSESTFKRPELNFAFTEIKLHEFSGAQFVVRENETELPLETSLPALFNVYNVGAAASAARLLEIDASLIQSSVTAFKPVFGRFEQIKVGAKTVVLFLIKNPVGFDQVISLLTTTPKKKKLVIAINDLIADGQDVSWLWDADIESLVPVIEHVTTTGTRAHEMAMRLHYADQPMDHVDCQNDLGTALDSALASDAETVYCLLTYTAMNNLRDILATKKLVTRFQASEEV